MWRIAMFDGLSARQGERVVERFMTQKAATLVAYLALLPRRHSREELVELLWPDVDPKVSRLRLNQTLSSLRRQFGQAGSHGDGLLLADRWSVQLNPELYTTDVAEFETLVASEDEESLRRGVDLYRGQLLPGIYEDWTYGERSRLANLYSSALERLRGFYRKEGRLEEAVAIAIRLLDEEPLREESHLGLIRLYALQGRTSLAIEQYGRMEAHLREIGETPSETARRILERIRKGDVPTVERRSPVAAQRARPADQPPSGAPDLPVRITRFFGRETEGESIQALLEEGDAWLATLTGPGGVGKTQLALEVARRTAEAFGGRSHFASLAEIGRPEEIVDAILAALNQRPSADEKGLQTLAAVFRRWDRSLLVLDNFEHVREAAPLVSDLLGLAPGLVVLATSRVPLGLAGERIVPVESLAFPPPGETIEEMMEYPAVQLFVDRARAARADFALTPRNKDDIRSLCARLEGLPLALELAAGWALTMSPSQMLKGLDKRFEFLKSRRKDVPDRHRSLLAAIEYGFSLLEEGSRRLFGALSIFQNGFTSEAASAVAAVAPIEEPLADLVERSLIHAEQADPIRFSMLESIREYGLAQLATEEGREFRGRHAAFFADLAQAACRDRTGPGQATRLRQLTDDHRNLLAALDWLEAENPALGLRMASDLAWYWEAKGHLRAGREWIGRLLALGSFPDGSTGRALNSLCWLTWNQGDLQTANEIGERARALFAGSDDTAGLQEADYNLGVVAFRCGEFDRARSLLGEALRLAEADGDRPGVSRALMLFGNVDRVTGRLEESKANYERSLRIEQELGNSMRACFALSNLGGLADDEGAFDLAAGYYERCIALSRETGHRSYEGVFLYNLGTTRIRQERYDEARQALREALRISVDLRRDHIAFRIVWDVAILAAKIPDVEASATLWGIASGMGERTPLEPADPERLARDEERTIPEEVRNGGAYLTARALGRTMSDSEAISFAFSWLV